MKLKRSWLAVASAALLTVGSLLTSVAHAQTTLRIQSTFPAQGLFQQGAEVFAERVAALSGGRLKIELLPAGAVVPPFETLDAVHKKVVDGGYSAPAYWVGKNKAATLFGPSPGGPFGMDLLDYLGWIYDDRGLALYREFYQEQLKQNVVVFAEVFAKSGMATVNLPGGEIVPSGQRGVIECAEFVGAGVDIAIGFHTIWKNFYPQSTHEPATVVELLINGDVWKSLAPDLQAIVQAATIEATMRSVALRHRQDAAALAEFSKNGVTMHKTPDDIVKKVLATWDEIAAAEAAKNPFFKKVQDSQRAYAAMVVPTRRTITVPYNATADYYFPPKK